jgi:hypothetical protein
VPTLVGDRIQWMSHDEREGKKKKKKKKVLVQS